MVDLLKKICMYGLLLQDSRSQQVDLKLLTRLYVDNKEEVRPCVEDIFTKEIEKIDFNPENTTDVINAWVEESTHGKIKQVLEPGSIRPQSKIAMVNWQCALM